MIGTWLFITNSNFFAYKSYIILIPMFILFLIFHPFFIILLIQNLLSRKWTFVGTLKRTLFKYHSKKIFNLYTSIFSEVAKEKKVWIVAGSCILPRVELSGSNLGVHNTNEGLYNISMIFNPNGKVVHIIFKHHLVAEELEFLDQGSIDEIQPFDIPKIGKLGLLICADSWFTESYRNLLNCDILASISFVTDETWKLKWKGYSGFPNEKEVDEKEINSILECEAWLKYALPGRIKFLKKSNARIVISSHFQGNIFFMKFGGQSFILEGESLNQAKYLEDTKLIFENEKSF